jgi:hypothetical protein
MVTITGNLVTGLNRVHVRDVPGNWTSLSAVPRSPTEVTVKLPGSLLSTEGFIQIGPDREPGHSLAFMVSAPGLPGLGTAPEVALTGMTPDDLGPGGGTLTVLGNGFAEGMRIVLGRGAKAGVVLPATLASETALQANLPLRFVGQADDLFVAVLAASGDRLSAPLSIESAASDPVQPSLLVTAGDVGLTSVSGDLVWNASDQALELEGVGLQAGMTVLFQT